MVNFTPRLLKREKRQAEPVNSPLETIKAKNLISPKLPSFKLNMTMEQAVKEFLEHNAPGGPVIDAQGKVVGYLSQKECLLQAKETRYNRTEIGYVSQYMTMLIHDVGKETTLRELVDLFADNWFHNYPVVDHGRLIGVVDRHEVLAAFAQTKATTW